MYDFSKLLIKAQNITRVTDLPNDEWKTVNSDLQVWHAIINWFITVIDSFIVVVMVTHSFFSAMGTDYYSRRRCVV